MKPSASRTQRVKEFSCVLVACLCPGFFLQAAPVEESKLPASSKATIDFTRDIEPILQQSCYKCHGAEKPRSGFDLTTRAAALKGGENGVDIVSGDSAKSPLIHYVAGISEEMEMPPSGKAPALTREQVSLLRAWIDQGVNYPPETPGEPQFSITPAIRWTTVQGDKGAFREHYWRKEGFAGGVEHFAIRDRSHEDVTVNVDGHVFSDANEVAVKFAATRKDFGFIHVGYEQYQRYYDDSGGYAPLLGTNSFRLNRDLHLDIGRAWIEAGIAVPDRPHVRVGYEYQFRDGNKSTLQWGPVGLLAPFANPTDAKNIYPAAKNIQEKTHILKFDASHEINGWYFEDNARVEFYDLATDRQDVLTHTFAPLPDTVARVDEAHNHLSGANTFHINKQLTDWMFASGGYLYSKLSGDASMNVRTLTGVGAPASGDQWSADQILLDRESHVGNIAGLLGPWDGLTISSGVQGEWTRQRTMSDVVFGIGNPATPPLFLSPVSNEGNTDDSSVRENVALRYTKIPFTTLYAETRLQQQALNRFEEAIGGFEPFTRETDADVHSMEYRAGFDTSPWQYVSFGVHAKRTDKETDYEQLQHFSPSGHPYPGFLLARNMVSDEIEPRLVIRPVKWLRATLTYRLVATDFDNATRGITGLTAGGDIFAGNYDEHVYSANVVLTPWRRLYLSSTASLTDSRTATARNGVNFLGDWAGDVVTILNSATFVLSEHTDLNASYTFSRADYSQQTAATGLPAGILYDRHAVEAGIFHQFENGVGAGLRYGFYRYAEPSSGGANDFTAHTLFGTVSLMW